MCRTAPCTHSQRTALERLRDNRQDGDDVRRGTPRPRRLGHLAAPRGGRLHRTSSADHRPSSTCATARRPSASFARSGPRYVILAAARVGGILANDQYPADVPLRQPADPAQRHGRGAGGGRRAARLPRLVVHLPQVRAAADQGGVLLTGPLEPTNDAYAVAKIAGILQVQAARKPVRPPLDLGDAHEPLRPRRQLLADDLARAAGADPPLTSRRKEAGARASSRTGAAARRSASSCTSTTSRARSRSCSRSYDAPEPINVGTGEDRTIRSSSPSSSPAWSATRARPHWDTSKPDGTPRKLLDVSRLKALGWSPTMLARGGSARDRGLVPRAPGRDPHLAAGSAGGQPGSATPGPRTARSIASTS